MRVARRRWIDGKRKGRTEHARAAEKHTHTHTTRTRTHTSSRAEHTGWKRKMSNLYLPVVVLEVSVVGGGAELALVLRVPNQVVQVDALQQQRRGVQADLLLLSQFAKHEKKRFERCGQGLTTGCAHSWRGRQ